jgi:MscS family membrane protein
VGRRADVLARAAAPLRLAVALLVYALAAHALALGSPVQTLLAPVERVLAVVALAWLLLRLTDVLAQTAERRFAAAGNAGAIAVVPLGRRTVKGFLLALACIAVLQNLGFNVTGLLAGLGIGGLAVALAAQKTVENLFGGVTLIADQPVRVGDFCRFGDHLGTIEDIGMRSTRVRTLDRTVVTVPNGQFAAMLLENFTRRDRIWLRAMIGLRYETSPDQLRFVLVELKKLLAGHPMIDPEPARVRFVGFGDSSLDLEVFAYVRTADYNEFLAVREDVLLRIMDVIASAGTSFAFPSQTLYVGSDGRLDERRTREAEAQVARWRDAGTPPLPGPGSVVSRPRDRS